MWQALHMVPGGAAGQYLLGRICRLSSRQKEAEGHFAAALTLDPLLWCAFEELCMLGTSLAADLSHIHLLSTLPLPGSPWCTTPQRPAQEADMGTSRE